MEHRFLPSFTGCPSPQIYDFNLTEEMEDIGPEYFSPTFTFPDNLFAEQTADSSTYPPAPLKTSSPPSLGQWFESPEDSSSSGSSNRHERKDSSESSSIGELAVGDTPMANGILIGADPVGANVAEDEESNIFMASTFDFVSASSSPTPISEVKPNHGETHSNFANMPVRSVPVITPANRRTSRSSESSGSPEIGLSMPYMKDQDSWAASSVRRVQRRPETSCAPSDLMKSDVTRRDARFPHSGAWSGHNVPAVAPIPNYDLSRMAMPYACPIVPPQKPQLYVTNFAPKTRVETQHTLKYTLDPMPPNVTKLHLQPYTIHRPKLMAKPTPARSPDMLELYATVVCSSAMEDRAKRERALARARGPLQNQEEHHPSSREGTSEDPSSKKTDSEEREGPEERGEEDESKPLNGGPVRICNGCIERERRRAERKKTINDVEQSQWKRLEAQRTVVFNISEVLEWQPPSPPKTVAGKEKRIPMPYYDVEPSFSPNAMQVDIPTRIACYCRHQEEKIGFRIIFTIRDHKDNVIAQTMSNSIMITDDHKSHPPPNLLQPSQMGHQISTGTVPGPDIFQQVHRNYHPTTPLARNAFSTTDLSRINQQFDPRISNPAGQFAMPPGSSQTTSATLTPRNLSRPASPTMIRDQQHKRRKASGSHRIRDDLRMTKYPNPPLTSPTPTIPIASPASGQPQPFFGANTAYAPNYAESPLFPMSAAPLHYTNTNPPTPTSATSAFPPNVFGAPRSQSMENLPQYMMSAPSSAFTSRAPSPRMTGGLPQPSQLGQPNGMPHVNGYGQMSDFQHAQRLTNSLHSVNAAPIQQQTPVILKLTPAEGPTAGGTQVACLGTGFSMDLEVMFGDACATNTAYWGPNALVCVVPPAVQAGTVPVTFKHYYEQNIKLSQDSQKYYTYIEADQQALMSVMMNIVSNRFNINSNRRSGDFLEDVRTLARQTIAKGSASDNGLPQGTSNQLQEMSESTAAVPKAEMEEILIKCLEQMDLDEGSAPANLNFRGTNGQAPLHLAASLGYYRVVAGLLARGAHADIRDNNGMSPMHMASLRGNVRVIRKLRSVGGDPTLRSLNGFTPADMTAAHDILDAINALDQHIRSRSAVATPISGISRAPSVLSRPSSVSDYELTRLSHGRSTNVEDLELYRSHPVTPIQMRARSRRNSLSAEERDSDEITQKGLNPNASQLATQSALTAWRDQLSVQIQQFQQTVHRALPPLPNLPDYQDYPVVRRISSLVPQRNAPLASSPENRPSQAAKETDYHWWELLTGATSAPPAYEDIYPDQHQSQQSLSNDDKKAPLVRAAGEALMDQKCEALFDDLDARAGSSATAAGVMETVSIGSKGLTQEQQNRLRSAHAKKIKRLRSDRNLFFIWIPLLILVVLAMTKDRAPLVLSAAYRMCHYVYERLPGTGADNTAGGRIIGEVR